MYPVASWVAVLYANCRAARCSFQFRSLLILADVLADHGLDGAIRAFDGVAVRRVHGCGVVTDVEGGQAVGELPRHELSPIIGQKYLWASVS